MLALTLRIDGMVFVFRRAKAAMRRGGMHRWHRFGRTQGRKRSPHRWGRYLQGPEVRGSPPTVFIMLVVKIRASKKFSRGYENPPGSADEVHNRALTVSIRLSRTAWCDILPPGFFLDPFAAQRCLGGAYPMIGPGGQVNQKKELRIGNSAICSSIHQRSRELGDSSY